MYSRSGDRSDISRDLRYKLSSLSREDFLTVYNHIEDVLLTMDDIDTMSSHNEAITTLIDTLLIEGVTVDELTSMIKDILGNEVRSKSRYSKSISSEEEEEYSKLSHDDKKLLKKKPYSNNVYKIIDMHIHNPKNMARILRYLTVRSKSYGNSKIDNTISYYLTSLSNIGNVVKYLRNSEIDSIIAILLPIKVKGKSLENKDKLLRKMFKRIRK